MRVDLFKKMKRSFKTIFTFINKILYSILYTRTDQFKIITKKNRQKFLQESGELI